MNVKIKYSDICERERLVLSVSDLYATFQRVLCAKNDTWAIPLEVFVNMADANVNVNRATGQDTDATEHPGVYVEEKSPHHTTGAQAPSRPLTLEELAHHQLLLRRSAEYYSLGVTHRVTVADFWAIVSAVVATYGYSSPLRARGNIPPSMLETISGATANLAAALAHSPAQGSPGTSIEKSRRPAAVKGGKPKTAVRTGGAKPRVKSSAAKQQKKDPPRGDTKPELSELDRARLALFRKARSALRTKEEELKRDYASLQLTEDLIRETVYGLSLQQLQRCPQGVPVLMALGLVSDERAGQFPDWVPSDTYTKRYRSYLDAASARRPQATPFPQSQERLATYKRKDLPFASTVEAVSKLHTEFLRPRSSDAPPVLLPALQEGPAEGLLINIRRPRRETGVHPLTLSRAGVQQRQRTFAQVVAADTAASSGGSFNVLLHGEESALEGKADVALVLAPTIKSKKEDARGELPLPPLKFSKREVARSSPLAVKPFYTVFLMSGNK